jgi:DNA (cytosine-5)-methyltransferase 1
MKVAGIDVYCGAGGLSCGLQRAGIRIVAGIDVDRACTFPFTHNIKSTFINRDVRDVSPVELQGFYPQGFYRLLAGCAPCRPFSKYRCGTKPSDHADWGLLAYFTKLVVNILPEFVTMENVPEMQDSPVFAEFLETLMRNDYSVDIHVVYCPQLGIPQKRKRLVLLASKIGEISVPKGSLSRLKFKTVRDCISGLPAIEAGESDANDPLHKARSCTPINIMRLKSSKPGGTWRDWPKALRAPCHRRKTGSTFPSE